MHKSGTRVTVVEENDKGAPHRLAGKTGVIVGVCKSVVPGWHKDIYRVDFGNNDIDFVAHRHLKLETEAIRPAGPA